MAFGNLLSLDAVTDKGYYHSGFTTTVTTSFTYSQTAPQGLAYRADLDEAGFHSSDDSVWVQTAGFTASVDNTYTASDDYRGSSCDGTYHIQHEDTNEVVRRRTWMTNNIIDTIQGPTTSARGCTWGATETDLILQDWDNKPTYRMTGFTTTVEATFDYTGDNRPREAYWDDDGEDLYITGTQDDLFVQFDGFTNSVLNTLDNVATYCTGVNSDIKWPGGAALQFISATTATGTADAPSTTTLELGLKIISATTATASIDALATTTLVRDSVLTATTATATLDAVAPAEIPRFLAATVATASIDALATTTLIRDSVLTATTATAAIDAVAAGDPARSAVATTATATVDALATTALELGLKIISATTATATADAVPETVLYQAGGSLQSLNATTATATVDAVAAGDPARSAVATTATATVSAVVATLIRDSVLAATTATATLDATAASIALTLQILSATTATASLDAPAAGDPARSAVATTATASITVVAAGDPARSVVATTATATLSVVAASLIRDAVLTATTATAAFAVPTASPVLTLQILSATVATAAFTAPTVLIIGGSIWLAVEPASTIWTQLQETDPTTIWTLDPAVDPTTDWSDAD